MIFTYSSQELDLIFPFSALSHGCEGACSDSGSHHWLPAETRCWASQADISIELIHSHIGQPGRAPTLLFSLLPPTPTSTPPPFLRPRRQQQCGPADGQSRGIRGQAPGGGGDGDDAAGSNDGWWWPEAKMLLIWNSLRWNPFFQLSQQFWRLPVWRMVVWRWTWMQKLWMIVSVFARSVHSTHSTFLSHAHPRTCTHLPPHIASAGLHTHVV